MRNDHDPAFTVLAILLWVMLFAGAFSFLENVKRSAVNDHIEATREAPVIETQFANGDCVMVYMFNDAYFMQECEVFEDGSGIVGENWFCLPGHMCVQEFSLPDNTSG